MRYECDAGAPSQQPRECDVYKCKCKCKCDKTVRGTPSRFTKRGWFCRGIKWDALGTRRGLETREGRNEKHAWDKKYGRYEGIAVNNYNALDIRAKGKAKAKRYRLSISRHVPPHLPIARPPAANLSRPSPLSQLRPPATTQGHHPPHIPTTLVVQERVTLQVSHFEGSR
jgi:hypothetical protein